MKPEISSPNINPENTTTQPEQRVEKLPDIDNSEKAVDSGAEVFEKKSEINAIMADVGLSTVIPTPATDNTTSATANGQSDDSTTVGNPLLANDDDLIEKEWVERAKKIVAETQNNPYQQDKEVNKLQIDYMKKRFGRELGVAE